jgi:UDP-2,3-diacylglucosamine hydrolase
MGSPGATLFSSDQHLSPERPAALGAFDAFAAGPARQAAAVYLLGDLFDWWVGDDQMREPFVADIVKSLRALSDSGVPLYVAHGNRDFLIGERFAQAAGAALLPDSLLLDLHGTRTLVCHGDQFCVDDVDYQAYRARMRNPATQARLLRLPYFARRMIARYLRRRSRDEKALKPESIMDVTPAAVESAFRDHRAARIIHGHTHRPARHHYEIDGTPRERVVLADWRTRGHYLAVDASGSADFDIA